MLYRKDKFLTIKDEWLAIPTDSGDDVFMVQLFKKQNYKILINDCDEAIVKTGLPENLSEFINQRVRWGAKTKYYKDSFLKVFGFDSSISKFNYCLVVCFDII